jgi:hypothetical protein
MTRPESISRVAERSSDLRTFSYELRDFLHEFERGFNVTGLDQFDRLREEPAILADRFPEGRLADAYLAAVADALAERLSRWGPGWTRKPERFLHEPWFASPGPHMRACLLLESPGAFRERNIFVTANALSVV